MSSAHESIKATHVSIMEDLEVRWVTNLSEDRKTFYLIAAQIDPHTKFLTFCHNKYFPTSWKGEGNGFLATEFKSFYSEIRGRILR